MLLVRPSRASSSMSACVSESTSRENETGKGVRERTQREEKGLEKKGLAKGLAGGARRVELAWPHNPTSGVRRSPSEISEIYRGASRDLRSLFEISAIRDLRSRIAPDPEIHAAGSGDLEIYELDAEI